MSRFLRATVFLILASCGASTEPPSDITDACAIVSQRPDFLRAMKRSEHRWGVPVAVQMATIYQESRFVGNARTPHSFLLGVIPMGRTSSAYGYSQALDGTWDDYKRDTGRRGARRDSIVDATDFMGWYMNGSAKKLGISTTDATRQYLAYHEGRTGYLRGSHRRKPWLMNIATQVGQRAVIYDTQLQFCSRR